MGAESALDIDGLAEHLAEVGLARCEPFFFFNVVLFDGELEVDEADFDGGESDNDVVEEEIAVGEAIVVEFCGFGVEFFEEFPEGDELSGCGFLGDGDIRLQRFGSEGREPGQWATGDEAGAETGAGGADGFGDADDFGGEQVFFEFFIGMLVEAGGVVGFAEVDGKFFGSWVLFASIGAGDDEVALDEGLVVCHLSHECMDDLVLLRWIFDEGEVLGCEIDLVMGGDWDHWE